MQRTDTDSTDMLKQKLRRQLLERRNAVEPAERSRMEDRLFERLTALPEFQLCQTLLCYVSAKGEADTRKLLTYSLDIGKKVAVPCCLRDGSIEFFEIESLEDLSVGTFGILEPDSAAAPQVRDNENACFCVVPGLAFDRFGGRIGYGKGYYDCFLSRYKGAAAGICFSDFLSGVPLPKGKYDIPLELIVTDRETIRLGNRDG